MPGTAGGGAAGGAHGQALGGIGGGGGAGAGGAAGGGNGAGGGGGAATREGGAAGGGGGGGIYMQHPTQGGGAGQRAVSDGMPYPPADLLSAVGNKGELCMLFGVPSLANGLGWVASVASPHLASPRVVPATAARFLCGDGSIVCVLLWECIVRQLHSS